MAVAFKQGYSITITISGILTVGTASLPWSEYYYRMASFWTPESVLFIIAVSLIQIRDSEVQPVLLSTCMHVYTVCVDEVS